MPRVMIGRRGRIVDLGPRDVLGSGGEATVFGTRKEAIKIYHQPTRGRAEKLQAFLKLGLSIPSEVVAPEELVYSARGQKIIGFTMRLLSPGQQVLETLTDRRHREANGITTRDVADIFIRLHGVLKALHQGGVVVGDLNPLNELYRRIEIALIDADSFQFGRFPCPVATARCLDPRLYGVDLSLRPMFIPNDDWYAYLVLLFSSLLLVHPYGGAHRKLRTILRRAEARITVLDPSVIYPQVAYPLEVTSDELLHLFSETFGNGWRGEPRLNLLEDYQSILIECSTCRLWYPHNRKECPGCRAINQMRMRMKQVVRGVKATELLTTKGPVVFFKLIGRTIYAVAIEQGKAVLYLKKSLEKPRRTVLFKATRGARYDLFDKFLVLCPEPYAEEPQLFLLDISEKVPVPVTKTTTERFGGRGAVFRGSAKYLWRLVGGFIMRGQIPFGKDLVDGMVGTGMENQIWFDVGSNPDQEVAFGYFRVIAKYEWFLVREGAQFPVAVPELESGEMMVDRSIRFSETSLLLLRRTRKAGKEFLRIDVVDIATGEVGCSRRVSLIDNPHLSDIHTPAYARGVILIPGGSGLIAEDAETGSQKTFPDAAQYVYPGDRLWRYEDGVLAVSANRVTKVTLVR